MGDIRELQSTEEEAAFVRATLAESAPADIDVDRAWAVFSQRIAAPTKHATPARGIRIRGRLITLPAIAATLALAILLMGAGYTFWAGPFVGSELQLIGQQHLYTAVNQSKTAGGLTITVTNVYADEGRTLIAYTISPSPALRQRYDHVIVASYDLVDQVGHPSPGAGTQCTQLPNDSGPIYCLMDMPSFGAPGDTLSLTWTIDTVWLMHSGSAQTDENSAGWRFAFTVPYLHVNNGVGAYLQICNTAQNPCAK